MKISIKPFSTFRTISLFIFGLMLVIVGFFSCNQKKKTTTDLFYLNHHDTVDYVGMAKCAACHQDKANTFIHTGMGSSFGNATQIKSAADFAHNQVIFDTINNLYYKPFWKVNELYFMEFRLNGKDTVHKRIEKIDFIIGSGQHTNSHLILRNGYVYQAPMTWYSQEKHWGLPPGFEKGRSSGFARIINDECMSCHNSMPVMNSESDQLFKQIGQGIDCERCHGPGELHVNLRSKGKTIKSKDGIDRTIVNPAKLSWQMQVDLCQRCHLQGNAVLQDGKRFTDFKPGMKLSNFFEVYMPKHENEETEFIMASHAQRLQLSQCFLSSNKSGNKNGLTCINCHNPHISVKETGVEQFNNACIKCHTDKNACSAEIKLREQNADNCVKCHMPSSGTTDIPHVTVHDHFIRKPKTGIMPKQGKLKGLYCINNENPTVKSQVKAYLSYYEKFDPNPLFLVEGRKLLNTIKDLQLEIYYYYLKSSSNKVIELSSKIDQADLDAWGNYRIGQSYLNLSKFEQAQKYLSLACKMQPDNFEFIYKLSNACHGIGKQLEEEELLKKVISMNPNHFEALNNLGLLYSTSGETNKAISYYQRAYQVSPDYLPLLKNMFDFYYKAQNLTKATKFAVAILKKEPQNKVLINFLKSVENN